MEGYASDHGHGEEYESPARATIFRMSEKPFECGPEEESPKSMSPATIVESLGRSKGLGTAPTAKPARS